MFLDEIRALKVHFSIRQNSVLVMIAKKENPSIRVIKRSDRELLKEQPGAQSSELKTDSQARREMVATIVSWIEERRQMMKNPPAFSNPTC